MVQLGRYPAPGHVIAHLSDTHLLEGSRPLYGAVDTDRTLIRAVEQLERSGAAPEAIVITGDLTDLGEPDAYQRLKDLVEPAAERIGAQIIWVMGNHDERSPFASILLGEDTDGRPQDRVYDVNGLRIIALDSSVPGYHHGDLAAGQLAWLADVLRTPAADGTLVALHHPPLPTPVELMAILELQHQDRFAEVLRGTDVRAILAGHLHYSMFGTFTGIPVSVAAATCYTLDASAGPQELAGVDGGQAFNLVNLYADTVVHSVVPIGRPPRISGFSGVILEQLARMTPEQRIEAFSNKRSTFDVAAFEV